MSAELVGPGHPEQPRAVSDAATSAAFDAVYTEHYIRLRRFIFGMTGQAALAEDITQETLLRAYVRMGSIDFERPLWPWLKTVATRLVFDNSRSRRRETLTAEPAAEHTTDSFDITAERQLLAEAMRALPARQRVAVVLRYVEDWKAAEVADALGLTRVAAEQLLLRARRRLSTEYLALDGERTRALRVALWPLMVVVAGLRDRVSRLRQHVAGSTTVQLSMSIDGATQAIAALTVGGVLLAGGATVAPRRAEAADHRDVTYATGFHSEQARPAVVAARSAGQATGQTLVASVSAAPKLSRDAASRTATAATDSGSSTPASTGPLQAPAAESTVTGVQVRTDDTPVDQAPAATTAKASKGRSGDRYLLRTRVDGRAGEVVAQAPVGINVECNRGTTGRTACAAADTVDEALPSTGD